MKLCKLTKWESEKEKNMVFAIGEDNCDRQIIAPVNCELNIVPTELVSINDIQIIGDFATKQKPITMEIIVKVKNVYGQEKVYPICEKAKTFARIAGTKTLTTETIGLIKSLGYTLTAQAVTI